METNIVSLPFSCILHIQNCSITRGGLPVTLEGRGVTMLERALDVKSGLTPPTSVLVIASRFLSRLRSAKPEAELGSFRL